MIREATNNDATGIAELYCRVWKPSYMTPDEVRTLYQHMFRELFLDPPAYDKEAPSLVYENKQGRIDGFLGVVVRAMRYHDKPIQMVVGTQLMSDPAVPRSVPLKLLRQTMNGPQELMYADMVNPRGTQFLEALGFTRLQWFSRHWMRPLRRVALTKALIRRRWMPRAQAARLKQNLPIGSVPDLQDTGGELTAEPITAEAWRDHMPGLLKESMRPDYSADWSPWIMRRLEHTFEGGIARGVLLRKRSGGVVGWYVYQCLPHDIGQVAQIVAAAGWEQPVVSHLFLDAHAQGLAALAGRVQPALLPTMRRAGCRMLRRGDTALAYSSKHPELIEAIQQGDAFLTRLEGEYSVNLDLTSPQVTRLHKRWSE